MGRVLFLAGLSTILLIGNVNGLAAQGRGGTGCRMVAAWALAALRGRCMRSSMAPARAAGHVTSSPGSHLAITTVTQRTDYGATRAARCAEPGGIAEVRALERNSSEASEELERTFPDDSNVPGLGFDAVHVAATRGNRGHDREHGSMDEVAGTNSECCFLFLMEAGITCRPDRTWPGMRKVTGKQ